MIATRRAALALALAAALPGCAQVQAVPESALEWPANESAMLRAFAQSFSETPFEHGAVTVIAAEGGDLRSYRLVPCRGGAAVCAGGLDGPAGRLELRPDYHVVTGLYGGRTFFLSPGGDGTLRLRSGVDVPLAWEATEPPVSDWQAFRYEGTAVRAGG